jgi:hypothetical protein
LGKGEGAKVSIIILSYRNFGYVRDCVDSVLASTYRDFKIYLVDNGSEKPVIDAIRERYGLHPGIELVENGKNLGYAEGNNVALRLARSEYVLLLNNDTVVDRGWLEPMVAMMDGDRGIGACQPKILDINDRARFEYSGAAGGFIDGYGYPFLRGRIFDTVEADNGQYDDDADLDWCSGTAFMVRSIALEKAGLFDPVYFMYGEENDLCWRIRRCGYRMVFAHGSKVYHLGKGSIAARPLYKLHLNHRNGMILLMKNLPLGRLAAVLPARLMLDLINGLFYLVNKPWSFRWISIIWAYLELVIIMPRIAYARRAAQTLYKKCGKGTRYPAYGISVVYQYFILGRKKFNELKLKR